MKVGESLTAIRLIRLTTVFICVGAFVALMIFGPFGVDPKAQTTPATEPRNLVIGQVISETLASGETRTYAFDSPSTQSAVVEIVKGDLRLKILVCPQQAQSCMELIPKRTGKIILPLSSAGRYKFELTSLEKESSSFKYELRVVSAANKNLQLMADALRTEADAEKLNSETGLPSRLIAASKYDDAARLWESAGQSTEAALVLCEVGDLYFSISDYPKALERYTKALSVSARGSLLSRLVALYGIGYIHLSKSDNQKATSYAHQMLDLIAKADPAEQNSPEYLQVKARALIIDGEVQYNVVNLKEAIRLLDSALAIGKQSGDRSVQALALLNLGYSYSDSGNPQVALDHYKQSLAIWQSIEDRRGIALAKTAMGGIHSTLGEEQVALELHTQAIEQLRLIGNRLGEAMALNGVGSVYQDMNKPQEAFDKYQEALRIYESIGNRGSAGLNKYSLGKMLFVMGDVDGAFAKFRDSLFISKDVKDRTVEAHSLRGLATVYFARGETDKAIKHFEEAVPLYHARSNIRSAAFTLNDLGHVYSVSGDVTKALSIYAEALNLMRKLNDYRGEALTLFNIAKAEYARRNFSEAQSLIEKAIEISESLRTKIKNSTLRTSFFASVHQQYQLYIDVLMSLHLQQPDKGFNAAALVVSERARARSLLDSLSEDRSAPDKKSSNDLFAKEQDLLRQIDQKAEHQTKILNRTHTDEEASQVAQDLRGLNLEYQDVRSRLREQSPRLATLTQPSQLTAKDIQAIIKDKDTALFEVSLGDERSFLWVVDSSGISSFELPGRTKIEDLARETYERLAARQLRARDSALTDEKLKVLDAEYWVKAAELSTMVLGPAAERLKTSRLLIVADGFLRYIPFEALPLPNQPVQTGDPDPLFLTHEIIGLPSALTLAAIRMERPEAYIPSRTIAVIADPVFESEDPRVTGLQPGNAPAASDDNNADLKVALRDLDEQDRGVIARLPSTSREAQSVVALTSEDERMIASGFDATKARVMNDALKEFRIIHFATHGLMNSQSPELSGVVLSLVDQQGNKQSGFLRLHDVYNMDLSADLVVLSACRTGLGRNIQGEGMVGLASGFMYAGAKSVMASLWKVDDDATAELMSHFYKALLKDGMTPAAALNTAKREMWKQPRWRAPFYWAGFTLQGEPATDLAVAPRTYGTRILVITSVLAVVIIGLYVFARYRHKKYRVSHG